MNDHQTVPISHNWAADTWDWPLERHEGVVKVHNDPEKFEVGLALGEYRPDEIKVSIIGDELVVHARHEVRPDAHGSVARELHRMYKLPPDVNTATLKSHLSQHGTLAITAGKKK